MAKVTNALGRFGPYVRSVESKRDSYFGFVAICICTIVVFGIWTSLFDTKYLLTWILGNALSYII